MRKYYILVAALVAALVIAIPAAIGANDDGGGGGAYPMWTGSCTYNNGGSVQSYDWNPNTGQYERVWKCQDGFWNEYRYDYLYRYWYFTGVRND